MRLWNRRTWALLATVTASVALAGQALGCTTSVSTAPLPPAGSAIMQWSVEESTDPGACDAHGATTFHVSLYNGVGGFAGEWVQDCHAFATTIYGLDPDDYTGHAELTDSSGHAVTTSVNLRPFTVVGASSTTVSIDFPANSFF